MVKGQSIHNADLYEQLSKDRSGTLHEFIKDNFEKVSEKIEDREVIWTYANADGEVVATIVFKDRENVFITVLKTRRGRDVWFLTELEGVK